MTADALVVARDRPRGRRRRSALYEAAGWVLVRAPVLPIEAYRAVSTGIGASDPLVRSAVAVGSRDLLGAVERGDADADAKLLRYLIRMSTRPTPYGLFAGVGLAACGSRTDLRLGAAAPRTRTRPDMAWLLAFVEELEARAEIRRGVRLLANPAVDVDGDRLVLAERDTLAGDDRPAVSVRATSVARRALALARTPIPYAELASELRSTPGATTEKVDQLLERLWRETLLFTELRPPLTGNPAAYVLDRLAGIPAAAEAHAALSELLAAMSEWDRLPLADRVDGYRRLTAAAERLCRGPDRDVVQVDAALTMSGRTVGEAVTRQAARAAELMLRLGPAGDGSAWIELYRHAFEARYGSDREVPLLRLLDPERGLGPPAPGAAGEHEAERTRQRALWDLGIGALRDRRTRVELDDDLLEQLSTCGPSPQNAPASLDVALFVLARSTQAIDEGDFTIVIGPNLGAGAAGRNLGRFADLLGEQARAGLAGVAAAEAALEPEAVLAELVYLPSRGRSANVAIRPAVRSHEIVVGTTPGVPADRAIPLNELVVVLRGGRLRVRWPPGDLEVQVCAGHMLNSHSAPVACRFLEAVSSQGRIPFSGFDWGPAAGLSFLPRVSRDRIVLEPAQWRIDAAWRARQLPAQPREHFERALDAWREEWAVPRHVYLAVGDNRLLLDLDESAQREQLRDELRRLPDGDGLLLQEALPGPEDAWLRGPHGHHVTELVVPLVRASEPGPVHGRAATDAALPPRTVAEPPAAARLRPPGSDWLFAKLYCPFAAQDALLAGPVGWLADFALGSCEVDRWFFIRYADPAPHLRLRFHGPPHALLGKLTPALCAWAQELIDKGDCKRLALDTYDREVERYGGVAAMAVAEEIFAADSRAVADLLAATRDTGGAPDRTTLAVLGVDALLGGLSLDEPSRLAWYRGAVTARHEAGDDYRQRQPVLRRLLGDSAALAREPSGAAVAAILARRGVALAAAAARLATLAERDELDHPLEFLCRSYAHLHCNRLLGEGPPNEQRVLGLLLRCREGLTRAPLDRVPAP